MQNNYFFALFTLVTARWYRSPSLGYNKTCKKYKRERDSATFFYNWTAATLGSGSKVTTANTDAEDSICPRGWKMPSYSGDRNNPGGDSWLNLVRTVYGASGYWEWTYNKANSWPLNFMRTGEYSCYSDYGGYIMERTKSSFWWSITSGSYSPAETSYYTYAIDSDGDASSGADYQSNSRGYGYAIRCVVRS